MAGTGGGRGAAAAAAEADQLPPVEMLTRKRSATGRVAVLDRAALLPNSAAGTRPVAVDELDADGFDTDAVRRADDLPAPQHDPSTYFCGNAIKTSRYTVLNFFPKNMFEQFSSAVNVYFLFVGALQAIDEISTTNGLPTIYLPLSFVLAVSAVRAAVEDHFRHQQDAKENSREYLVLRPDADDDEWSFQSVASRDIVVGDIVEVRSGQVFPADLMFVGSSHQAGHCFVETSNIDGETNLKVKVAPSLVHEYVTASGPASCGERMRAAGGMMMWETPNSKLDRFNAWMHGAFCGKDNAVVPFDASNLLLRGTKLANTQFVIGVVAYTGDDTKIRRNATKHSSVTKIKSSVFRRVDWYLLGMLMLQIALCVVGAGIAAWWQKEFKDIRPAWYLQLTASPVREGVVRFFTWFIILSQFVPISLLVTGEFVKTFQAWFINRDLSMYHAPTDTRANVRTLMLNEDLGQIEYVFSDKTGTLTQNVMQFRAAIVRGQQWGSSETEISKRVRERVSGVRRTTSWTELEKQVRAAEEADFLLAAATNGTEGGGGGGSELAARDEEKKSPASASEPLRRSESTYVNFDDRDRMLDNLWGAGAGAGAGDGHGAAMSQRQRVQQQRSDPEDLRRFLTHLCISNTITPVKDEATGETTLQSSSPDELSLCSYAKYMGFEYVQRNPTTIRINKFGRGPDELEEYKMLAALEFNGRRKRVTIIYERGPVIHVMSKGADSVMMPLVASDAKSDVEEMVRYLDELSDNGLRTLVVAFADRDTDWWQRWKSEFEYVRSLPERGSEANHTRGACSAQCRICSTYRQIEEDASLKLLGATAIDDQLQALVPEAIEDFLSTGIKVWMLTGDKLQTAKNIGMACNLVDPDMQKKGLTNWKESRLIHVTGKWSRLHKLKPHEQRELFHAFEDEVKGEDVVARLRALFHLLHLHDTVHDDTLHAALSDAGVHVSAPSASFEEFCRVLANIRISVRHAVQADIRRGLVVVKRHIADMPVSMVVEGSALGVLYPPANVPRSLRTASPPSPDAIRNGARGGRGGGGRDAQEESPSKIKTKRTDTNSSTAKPDHSDAVAVRVVRDGDADAGGDGDGNEEKGRKAVEHFVRATNAQGGTFAGDAPDADLQDMQTTFFQLATVCKSVIACRLTPYQKAQIIQQVQERHNAITLAIGDGANDEPMIRASHVGVGIEGLEGSAAANAADYSIGQFRFLHTLLFVHGYWNYQRIAKLVGYIFFKTIMMRLCMFWFGFFSGFSGQQFFHEFLAIWFNVAMTAVPIMVLATLDQPLERRTLENEPRVYASVVRAQVFNAAFFAGWIARAFVYSLLIFFVAYGSMGLAQANNTDGCDHGLFVFSSVTYVGVVFVATFRIMFEMDTITWIHHFFVYLSALGSFAVCYVMSSIPSIGDLYGTMRRGFTSPASWLSFALIVALPLLTGFTTHAIRREFRPTVTTVMQEQQRLKKTRAGGSEDVIVVNKSGGGGSGSNGLLHRRGQQLQEPAS